MVGVSEYSCSSTLLPGQRMSLGSTKVDGPNAEKIRRAKLKHSFQLAPLKGRHR